MSTPATPESSVAPDAPAPRKLLLIVSGIAVFILVALVVAVFVLWATGHEALTSQQRLQADDVSIEVHDSWTRRAAVEDGPVAIVAQGPDRADLTVTVYDSAGRAEERAETQVRALANSNPPVTCNRVADAERIGDAQVMYDCPQAQADRPMRRVLATYVEGDRSALVIVQTAGANLERARAELEPILESFEWR